jgi:hypothetical protein
MTRREVNLIGGFYRDESLPFSSQDAINWLPEPDESGMGRSPWRMLGVPGLKSISAEVIISPLDIYGDAYDSVEGRVYSYTFNAIGGTPPYRFAIVNGLLPVGLSLDADTGVISGTLTRGGDYTFTIEASDSDGGFAALQDSVRVIGAGQPGGSVDPPILPTQAAPLVNGGFESGNTGWTVNAQTRINFGKPPVSPGFVITNAPGRTGSWVMRWTGDPAGAGDACFNATVARTNPNTTYNASAYVRCTSKTGDGVLSAAIFVERFADEALTIGTGSSSSNFVTFNAAGGGWQPLTCFITSGGYVRLSLLVTQVVPIPVTAVLEFDDVVWDVQEIIP